MSRLATLLMFFAWLLYGAMPATAMPIAPAGAMKHDMHDGAMAHMPGMAHMPAQQEHCPHGGKTCIAPFCAACLTLLPEIAFLVSEGARNLAFQPAPEPVLIAGIPAPATPPPRV